MTKPSTNTVGSSSQDADMDISLDSQAGSSRPSTAEVLLKHTRREEDDGNSDRGLLCLPAAEFLTSDPWTLPELQPDEQTTMLGRTCVGLYAATGVPLMDGDFYTASDTEYHTASAGLNTHCALSIVQDNPYTRALGAKNLWPVDPMVEQNWSGRGQHAVFNQSERHILNNTLEFHKTLGTTATAKVESVKCRRILLARKTVLCNRRFPVSKAIDEAAELGRLKHSHILRVIGTYMIGKEFSILLYPVAEYNLGDWLAFIRKPVASDYEHWPENVLSTTGFLPCLSAAVHYMHSRFTKHMDIKPQNVLVRRTMEEGHPQFRVFLADFGISRSYERLEAVETDGRTSFTYKYAAPEVIDQNYRGLSADIFSLGCVFLEICTSVSDAYAKKFWVDDKATGLTKSTSSQFTQMCHLLGEGSTEPKPYSAIISELQTYLDTVPFEVSCIPQDPSAIISAMISLNPRDRPNADTLVRHFGKHHCCREVVPPLEAMVEDLNEDVSDDVDDEEDDEEDRVYLRNGDDFMFVGIGACWQPEQRVIDRCAENGISEQSRSHRGKFARYDDTAD